MACDVCAESLPIAPFGGHRPSRSALAGPAIATRRERVYSPTYPNGECFPLLIYFLCNAYRHSMTFAKWHLRVLGMNLSNVLWANKAILLERLVFELCGVFRIPSTGRGRQAGGFNV
jgi:hypothetical protein